MLISSMSFRVDCSHEKAAKRDTRLTEVLLTPVWTTL